MNRSLLNLTLLFLLCCSNTWAQKKRITRQHKHVIQEINIDSILHNYDFIQAESLLQRKIEQKRKRKENTLKEEELLFNARKGIQMMSAVERVVIIDSIIVHRKRLLAALPLSSESGHVTLAKEKGQGNHPFATLFQNEMGDRILFSKTNKDSILQLYSSNILDGEVTIPQPLKGLDEEPDIPYNYPYMMSDGITLYFAKQGPESLGGYDIFMTRYDTDQQRYLLPENIGMPFNSPANDYLYCIDESYNIGCFATDRGMAPDSICVYYFIPNAARRVYIEEEVGITALRNLARISSIQLTWQEQSQVHDAIVKLNACKNEQQTTEQNGFSFVLTDNRIYHSLEEFNHPQARLQAMQWQKQLQEQTQLNAQLHLLRKQYAYKNMPTINNLTTQILQLENQQFNLRKKIKNLENKIRQLELGI